MLREVRVRDTLCAKQTRRRSMNKWFSDNEIDDLLFTIDVAEKALPGNVHPVHLHRLDRLRVLLRAMRSQEQRQQLRLLDDEELEK